MFDLTNRIALVTGAGSGIGAAIAVTFAAAGARVYVTDRDEAAARATASSIRGTATSLTLDVTHEQQCSERARHVLAESGRLDILVNCAGVGHVGTILQTAGADLDRVYACNVRGVFNVSKAFVPSMLQRRSDRKSTRLNSSHGYISYAVFCSKKKKPTNDECHRVQEKTKQTD